jgi:hypothetical protein
MSVNHTTGPTGWLESICARDRSDGGTSLVREASRAWFWAMQQRLVDSKLPDRNL